MGGLKYTKWSKPVEDKLTAAIARLRQVKKTIPPPQQPLYAWGRPPMVRPPLKPSCPEEVIFFRGGLPYHTVTQEIFEMALWCGQNQLEPTYTTKGDGYIRFLFPDLAQATFFKLRWQ